MEKKIPMMLILSCCIGLFLGIGSLVWFSQGMWASRNINLAFIDYLPGYSGSLFGLGLIVSSLFCFLRRKWARALFICLMSVNFLITTFFYISVQTGLKFFPPDLGRQLVIPFLSFHHVADIIKFARLAFDDPRVFVFYWIRLLFSVILPLIVLIYLSHPKVKEQFR